MAKKTSEAPIVDVEEVYSKGEQYIEKNKKSLGIIAGVIVGFIALYFGYDIFYVQEKADAAVDDMWNAQNYFAQDSFRLALNGDFNAGTKGFLELADDYSAVDAGNTATYYAGICYLRMGQYDDAIDYLTDYSGDDEIFAAMALGCTGDAYLELGQTDQAMSYYEKAIAKRDNGFTTPLYLKKAADLSETLGDYDDAINYYERIKKDYPKSDIARNVDKYLTRARLLAKK